MRLGNNTTGLTFRQAIIVDFRNSSHGCACSRDYDAARAAVDSGKVGKKGTESFPIPGMDEKVYVVANGEHRELLKPLYQAAENAEREYYDAETVLAERIAKQRQRNTQKSILSAIEEMKTKGMEEIKYLDLAKLAPRR